MNPASASGAPARVTGWDRGVVALLGGAGCALSFSALQQMAVAIHIRPTLCWLFPLVIDGFIAYGVRALLVLRTAPLRARLYVWTLFGTATAVSVWANALHAVRLNQAAGSAIGLRLGGAVVAVLSTVAPLALAGAVHLYILIARGPDSDRRAVRSSVRDGAGQAPPRPGRGTTGQAPAVRPPLSPDRPDADIPAAVPDNHTLPDTGHPDRAQPPVTGRPAPTSRVTHRTPRTPGGRQHAPDTEQLLAIARSAVTAHDKLTRKVVAQAIRGQSIPLSNDTLTQLMVKLREQHGQPVTAARG